MFNNLTKMRKYDLWINLLIILSIVKCFYNKSLKTDILYIRDLHSLAGRTSELSYRSHEIFSWSSQVY